jgi:phosphonopyruvate decarboxylase
MIDPLKFYNSLMEKKVNFFVGVPDSLLKSFCSCIDGEADKENHIISANEGNAIGIASGYHLATRKIPVVYMQNSGLGNCVNPLSSLTHAKVYGIPLLLIIGWRGAPGEPDEPQHIVQGKTTPDLLALLDIDFSVIDSDSDADSVILHCLNKIKLNNSPAAILVRANSFSKYQPPRKMVSHFDFSREQALAEILSLAPKEALLISTTGKCSRELSEIRELRGEEQSDFLTVGSMGHASSISLGVSIGTPSKKVVCIDGDGSVLMHLGALPINGSNAPPNFLHIIFNNGSHESVGGQPTVAREIDFRAMSSSFNYKNFFEVCSANELRKEWENTFFSLGPTMLVINVDSVSRKNLNRPKSTPKANKNKFMQKICNE